MSDESRGQQRDAPPQYSADGRWWWDGQKWIPIQQSPTQRQYPPPPQSSDSLVQDSSKALTPTAPGLPLAAAAETSTGEALAGGGQHRGTQPPAADAAVSATAGWALGLGIATTVLATIAMASSVLPENPGVAVVALTLPAVLVLGVLAIVLGILAQRQIARSHGVLRGRTMAIVGWICGLCGLAIPVGIGFLGSSPGP
jgi:hypothetical protein